MSAPTPHCSWCSDPWRAVLLVLSRQGVQAACIARHYGLPATTVRSTLIHARKNGCIPLPRCRYCRMEITRVGGLCGTLACKRAYAREYMALRRAAGVHEARLGRQKAPEPVGVVWPKLPRNKRAHSAPKPVKQRPIRPGMPIMTPPPPIALRRADGVVLLGTAPTFPIGSLCGSMAA